MNRIFEEKLNLTLSKLINNKEILGFKEIWLYGSLARNDVTINSDIDIKRRSI